MRQTTKTNEGKNNVTKIKLPGHLLDGEVVEVVATCQGKDGFLMVKRPDGIGMPVSLQALKTGMFPERGLLQLEGLMKIVHYLAKAKDEIK